MDNAIDLLFEIRELIEENLPIHCNASIVTRIINHTNDYAASSRLRSNGNAHRDRLVAARLNLSRES